MEQITNDERFKNIMQIANDMALNVSGDLEGVARVTLRQQEIITELTAICKNQEYRIKVLEDKGIGI